MPWPSFPDFSVQLSAVFPEIHIRTIYKMGAVLLISLLLVLIQFTPFLVWKSNSTVYLDFL